MTLFDSSVYVIIDLFGIEVSLRIRLAAYFNVDFISFLFKTERR